MNIPLIDIFALTTYQDTASAPFFDEAQWFADAESHNVCAFRKVRPVDRVDNFRAVFSRVAALLKEERGAVAIQLGLLIVILMAMVGLGTEITFLLMKHRQMQAAADSAALGAAMAASAGYPADYTIEAYAAAASAGYTNGTQRVSVTINRPPLTGNHVGDASAIEVVVAQPQTLHLVSLLKKSDFNVGARATAMTGGTGTACALQLYPSASPGVNISNGAVVNLVDCGLGLNSTSSASLSMSGGAVLNAKSVSTAGNISVTNGAVINATNGVKINQPPVDDPYASVPHPSYSGCNFNNKTFGSSPNQQYADPGVYCNGLTMGNDARVTMRPGVYIIDRGTFNIGGAVQVTGTGVTIFLTSSTGSGFAKVDVGNGARMVLSAPASGPNAGLAFFGDRRANTSVTHNFGGGAAFAITGSLYFPTQKVTFNNGISNPSGCTQLIAGIIDFKGGAQFKNNCAATGVIPIGGGRVSLVE